MSSQGWRKPLQPMYRFLTVIAFCALASFTTAPASVSYDDLEDLVEEVKQNREETDPEVLDKITAIGGRAAAQALLDIYASQGSLFIRIEVIRRLPKFDGLEDTGQLALQHLMDVATAADDIELREEALEALGQCTELGKGFLEMIIESAAEDEVREQSMRIHIRLSAEEDHPWYRKIYEKEIEESKPDKKAKRKKKKEGEQGEPIIYRFPQLAFLAFEVLAPTMEIEELLDVIDDGKPSVQFIALSRLRELDLKKAGKLASGLYKHPETPNSLRVLAAGILKDVSAKKAAKQFLTDGGKFATPGPFRMALADYLAEINDPSINKKLTRSVEKGKPYEQRFALRALVAYEAKGLDEDVIELLMEEEDKSVVLAAAKFLVSRGIQEAGEPIEALLKKFEDPSEVAQAMDMLGELYKDSDNWDGKLLEFSKAVDTEIRNAALTQLMKDKRLDHLDVVLEQLGNDDWSTRLTCLNALVPLRDKRTVGPIVKQMQHEIGRLKIEFGDALFSLTGQHYNASPKAWLGWWEKEGKAFEIISLAKLEDVRAAQELRRLKEVTNARFFGIRIVSHRVIFILDVSGSMEEKMRLQVEGETALTRMAVARRELIAAIQGLARGALFNLITFSSGVDSWLEGGVASADTVSREEAEAFVARQIPGGGTNLYEAIQLAFEDPDVDTIFILSDGEPSVGEVVDVGQIREEVARWNEHRKIKINTIGVGLKLKILEWLSEDSGGRHVKLR